MSFLRSFCHSRAGGNLRFLSLEGRGQGEGGKICHREERSKPAPAKAGEAIPYYLIQGYDR